jgi:tRNA(adenine34) deaminase
MKWMREAILEAEKAAALGEVPVGAVLVRGDEVLARAHNRMESDQDSTSHAEMLAIREASKRSGSWRLSDTQLFVTLEPCPMCLGAIILARVPKIYFGAWDPRLGAAGSRFDLSDYPEFPHKVEVYPEVLKDECEALLKSFFEGCR